MIVLDWNSDLAYAVGLFATDGYLSIDGRHLDLTSKDIEQLENFQKALGIDCKISLKSTGFKKGYCPRIQFSNVQLYRWFLSIGLEQQKTEKLGEIKIPNKYFFDFLRGHFDGDGSIYSYFDPRWKSSFMFYITFIAKSKSHLIWLQKKIQELCGVVGKLGQGSRVFRLRYAKKESKTLIARMYKSKETLYLSRKYDKIVKILEIDADVL